MGEWKVSKGMNPDAERQTLNRILREIQETISNLPGGSGTVGPQGPAGPRGPQGESGTGTDVDETLIWLGV